MRGWSTGWICSGWLAMALLAAQESPGPNAAAPRQPGRPGDGLDPDSAVLFRVCRMADADGDLLVGEKELNSAFLRLQQDAAKVRANLLTWLDADKNGALSQEELRPFHTATQMLQLIRGVDQNGDLALQEPELDAAFTRMADACQSANDRLLSQFDRDRDGKLAGEELSMARQGLGVSPGPGQGPGVAAAAAGRRGPPRGGPAARQRAAAP